MSNPAIYDRASGQWYVAVDPTYQVKTGDPIDLQAWADAPPEKWPELVEASVSIGNYHAKVDIENASLNSWSKFIGYISACIMFYVVVMLISAVVFK